MPTKLRVEPLSNALGAISNLGFLNSREGTTLAVHIPGNFIGLAELGSSFHLLSAQIRNPKETIVPTQVEVFHRATDPSGIRSWHGSPDCLFGPRLDLMLGNGNRALRLRQAEISARDVVGVDVSQGLLGFVDQVVTSFLCSLPRLTGKDVALTGDSNEGRLWRASGQAKECN